MMEILIGIAVGLVVAAAGLLGYRQGLKDSKGRYKPNRINDDKTGEQQDALMKKYETIMSYDPYGENV